MGQSEDILMEIYYQMEELNLNNEFREQLEKNNKEDKFKYVEAYRVWEYTRDEIISKYKENND